MKMRYENRAMGKVLILLTSILLLSTVAPAVQGQSTQLNLPSSNLVAYVPIELVNTQPAPLVNGTQVMITLDWSQYETYLAPNLANVEFFSGGWIPLYAWLESNATSSAKESSVWIKLDGNGIGANSSATIYLGFLNLSVNNFSPTGYWGEAPRLSPNYGEYDNGAMVFVSYSNFSGFNLTAGWSTSNMDFTVLNGLVAQAVGSGITGSISYFKGFNPETEVLDSSAYFTGLNGGTGKQFIGWESGGTGRVLLGLSDAGNGTQYSLVTSRTGTGSSHRSIQNGSLSGFQIWSMGAVGNRYAYLEMNYHDNVTISPYYVSTVSYPAITSQTTSSFIFVQWIRTRTAPPNSIMPTSTFGKVERPYLVTFTEYGLPAGTNWSVVLNGVSKFSTTGSIDFQVTKGTYTYGIQNVTGFLVSPQSSSFEMTGSNLSFKVTFSKLYPISIMETGLPGGTEWSLVMNGENFTSSNSSMDFQLTNGTFHYSIQNMTYYNATRPNGTIRVDGSPLNVRITFVLMVQFTFIEIGLSEHSHWSVYINGKFYDSSIPFIEITLPNGTYNYVVVLPSGYETNAAGGKVDQNNSVVLINATSPVRTDAEISILAVLVALVAFYSIRRSRKNRARSREDQEQKER